MEFKRQTNLNTIYKVKNEKSVAYLNKRGNMIPLTISNTVGADPTLDKVCNFEFEDQLLTGISDTVEGYMYLNGIKGKKTEYLLFHPKFSKDGNHFAYTCNSTSYISVEGSDQNTPLIKQVIVVDDIEYGPYDRINDDFIFSGNNKNWAVSAQSSPSSMLPAALSSMFGGINIAHSASANTKQFIVFNGQKQKEYPALSSSPFFSNDGERLAYIAKIGKVNNPIVDIAFGSVTPELVKMSKEQMFKDLKYCAVIDGIESKEYEDIKQIIFSPDGTQHVHDATIGDKSFLVINGQEQPNTHDGIFNISYDSNGKLFYMVGNKSKGKYCVMIDGIEQKWYDYIEPSSIVFSKDGNHHAYIANIGTQWCIVLDGEEIGSYKQIELNSLVFSPDGNRFAFIVKEGEKKRLIIDKNAQELFDNVFKPVFSPNSQRFAYKVIDNNKNFAIIDGIEQEKYLFILDNFFFSPDNSNVAYIAGFQEGELQLLNQTRTRIVVTVIMNNKKGETFNQILEYPQANLVWKENNSMNYIAIKRVEEFINIYKVEEIFS